MSHSIVGTTPDFGFLGLTFAATFYGADFDHDFPIAFVAQGLPPGVVLGSGTTVGHLVQAFTTDHTNDILNFSGAHHLQIGDKVQVVSSGALPGGLVALTDYYVVATDFTTTACKLSTSPGGSVQALSNNGTGTHTLTWLPAFDNGVLMTGEPTAAGIYSIKISASGSVSGIQQTLVYTNTVIIEGDHASRPASRWLAFYHLKLAEDPPQRRPDFDLQYNAETRQFGSIAQNLADGLEFYLGQNVRLHAIISRNGAQTLGDYTPALPDPAPTNVSLIIRPEHNFAARPFLRMAATGTEALGIPTFTTRDVPYFDFTLGNPRLREAFRQLNRGDGGDPSSAYLPGSAQLRFDLDGRTHITPPLRAKILQPLNR